MATAGEDHQEIYKSTFFFHFKIKFFLVVLAGDSGVGKTHILNRFPFFRDLNVIFFIILSYIKGQIPKNNIVPTIGVEFATKIVSLRGGDKIKAQIWDTGLVFS